jgi:glycosyltransferase involved in cell wall biosynthesis
MLTSVHCWHDVRIYEKEARSLARAGHEVVVVGPGKSGAGEDGVRVLPVRVPVRRLARMTTGVARVLRHARSTGSDVYHLHDPELLVGGLVLRALGRKVVYDVHEDYPEQLRSKHYLPAWLRRVLVPVIACAEKALAGCLSGVVAATDHIAAKFGGRNVITVRNYPKAVETAPGSTAGPVQGPLCTANGARRTVFRLIHASGTLTEERGVTNLVKAMELLGDGFELVLVGRFVTPDYEAQVRAMPGFSRIQHQGLLAHGQVWDWYRRCDAGVVCLLPLPRYQVSLPVKLFEYMAAGLPVVASSFPLFRTIVESSGCGVCVNPEQPDGIAAAVRMLAADPARREQMAAGGRAAVARTYNWKSEAERLCCLYQGLAR